MLLSDLTIESNIKLEVVSGNDKIYIDASIAQVLKSGIVLFPVTYEGKIVSFKDNHNIVNLVLYQADGKPSIWKNVSVSHAMMNGRAFVLVRSLEESSEYNRRRNYRLPLDIKGNVLGSGEVIVHDISNGGISFYMDQYGSCTVGQTVNIGFSARNCNYAVSATVVRVVEEEGRCLYGCTMKSTPLLDQFISEEQRYRLKGY